MKFQGMLIPSEGDAFTIPGRPTAITAQAAALAEARRLIRNPHGPRFVEIVVLQGREAVDGMGLMVDEKGETQ